MPQALLEVLEWAAFLSSLLCVFCYGHSKLQGACVTEQYPRMHVVKQMTNDYTIGQYGGWVVADEGLRVNTKATYDAILAHVEKLRKMVQASA